MENSIKKNILIVEDNIESQLIFKIYLRDYYNVIITGNGSEGLQYLQEKNLDLIVLDINLPGDIDGIKFIEVARGILKLKNIPILVVTAYAKKGDREIILAKGADDYMSKPIEKLLFLQKVKNLI